MLHSGIGLQTNDRVIDTLDANDTAVANRRLRAEQPQVVRYARKLRGPHGTVVETAAKSYCWPTG